MAWYDFIFNLSNLPEGVSALIWATIIYVPIIILLVIIWIATSSKKKKSVDVTALAALAASDSYPEDAAPDANPKEVMTILSIERVAASTALSAAKDASRNRRISSSVAHSLVNRYQARINKIETDMKRRSGAQEYQSLAQSLEESRDRLRDEVIPRSTSHPPPSPTPGIPSAAPPVPGSRPPVGPPPSSGPPSIPTGPPSMGGVPPTKPSSPIPTPPKIPTMGPSTARPTTVVPPSVAPPTISTPTLPPRPPTTDSFVPPTTSDLVPPPVPTSMPTSISSTSMAPTTGDSDTQSISGLRMEMLRELARLKKFMSEETQ